MILFSSLEAPLLFQNMKNVALKLSLIILDPKTNLQYTYPVQV